jgi:hypothetical protein
MNSKSLFWLLTIACLTTASIAEAQQPKKLPRIGYISNDAGPELRERAFLQGLEDLRSFYGKNVPLDFR